MKGGKWGVREREKRPMSQPSILNGEKASFLKCKAHHFRLLAQKRASVFLSQKVALISPPLVSKSGSHLSAFCLKKLLSSLRLLSQKVAFISPPFVSTSVAHLVCTGEVSARLLPLQAQGEGLAAGGGHRWVYQRWEEHAAQSAVRQPRGATLPPPLPTPNPLPTPTL